jgi:dTDP-4-amino-4,6-dideoxygalactose transaminase
MYARRVQLKALYDRAFMAHDLVRIPSILPKGRSALHLYILLLNLDGLSVSRNQFLEIAKEAGIHLSVHYTPVHLFTEFRKSFSYKPEDFPAAYAAGQSAISLPFYPDLTDLEAQYVVDTILRLLEQYRR